MGRLTDADRNFFNGKLTIGKTDWKAFRLIYSTGAGEDYPKEKGNTITGYLDGYCFRLTLPEIIKPYALKIQAKYWDKATIERMGRDWYYEYLDKEYGFSYSENYLQLFHGVQCDGDTYDEVPDQRKSWFLPWGEYRQEKYRFFDSFDKPYQILYEEKGFNEYYKIKEVMPIVNYSIRDYDGVTVIATTKIIERTYQRGTKSFKWLSKIFKDKVYKSLEIDFNNEVGTAKGSWKGGLVWTSIEMLPNETRDDAFKRYCCMTHRDKHGSYHIQFIERLT